MSLDILARLLILEGVGNVDPFSWSHCATPRALRKAQQRLGGTPAAQWFQTTTRTYSILLNRLQGDLRRSGLRHVTGEDLMQQALAGLTAQGQPCKNKFHAIGVLARENILEGVETPSRLAQGTLGTWLHRMALNQLKKKDATLSLDGMEHTPHVTYEAIDPLTVLAHCMFGQDKVALSLQQLIRETAHQRFQEDTKGRLHMDTWVDRLQQGQLLTPGTQWAIAAGTMDTSTPRTRNSSIKAVNNTWRLFSPLLRRAVQNDPDICQLLDLQVTYESDARAHFPRCTTSC